MTVSELQALVEGKPNHAVVDLYLPSEIAGAVGTTTTVMPGVPGFVIRKMDGQTQVRVQVGKLRHALHLLLMEAA